MDDWFGPFANREKNSDGDFASERRQMIEDQLVRSGRDISNEAVLAAMAKVPRHEFVPERFGAEAYHDRPLAIGHGQTISQPFIVAFMTEQLDPRASDRVLEIGTGCGYQTAVLAELAGEVFSVEIVAELSRDAADTLGRLGHRNVHLRIGDGAMGWPEAAPFDGIIGTCAPDDVPQALIDQLAEGGRIVFPVGVADKQEVVVLRKRAGRVERRAVLPVRFVPMTGGANNLQTNGE